MAVLFSKQPPCPRPLNPNARSAKLQLPAVVLAATRHGTVPLNTNNSTLKWIISPSSTVAPSMKDWKEHKRTCTAPTADEVKGIFFEAGKDAPTLITVPLRTYDESDLFGERTGEAQLPFLPPLLGDGYHITLHITDDGIEGPALSQPYHLFVRYDFLNDGSPPNDIPKILTNGRAPHGWAGNFVALKERHPCSQKWTDCTIEEDLPILVKYFDWYPPQKENKLEMDWRTYTSARSAKLQLPTVALAAAMSGTVPLNTNGRVETDLFGEKIGEFKMPILSSLLGGGHYDALHVPYNGIGGPPLKQPYRLFIRDNFLNDGSPLNRIPKKLTNGRAPHGWAGNLLALKETHVGSGQWVDCTIEDDLPILTKYFEWYPSLSPGHKPGIQLYTF
ncbi:hypothetical protein ID866_5567 [Astraeus odoratus]|nr:hypothetical protein ID866_5567 [Astraeus odoratus]